jgi:hypothetical protein
MLHHAVSLKLTDISKVLTNIALTMVVETTSERLINFYETTRHNIPENGNLHTHCCDNLKFCLL